MPGLSQDDIVRIMRESGALDVLDINEDDVRAGHRRVREVLPSMEGAYALGAKRAFLATNEDYARCRARLDAMSNRLRALIVDLIEVNGSGSSEHLALKWALTGEGPAAATEAAQAIVKIQQNEGTES